MDWKTFRGVLGLVRLAASARIIRQLQTIQFYTDFIDKDLDATVKGVVHSWLTEFKSVKRIQRRVQTEWNVDPPTTKSTHQWEKNFKGDGSFGISKSGKYP
ncbi:hypothetical protein TNCV_3913161 [Trichonephila clavipes]|nr:hypothetical protein TNCV_3913161 [Trichonephila clavipes]